MELKFENKCTYTYEYYLQLKRKTMDKSFRNTGIGFTVIMALLALFCLFKQQYYFLIATVAAVLFGVYRVVGTPIRLAAFAERKNVEIHGQDVETLNSFYEDHFLAKNLLSGGLANIKYTDVLKVLESKDLYIMEMEEKLVIMLDKEGFTKGEAEAFPDFIREKCVNAEVGI